MTKPVEYKSTISDVQIQGPNQINLSYVIPEGQPEGEYLVWGGSSVHEMQNPIDSKPLKHHARNLTITVDKNVNFNSESYVVGVAAQPHGVSAITAVGAVAIIQPGQKIVTQETSLKLDSQSNDSLDLSYSVPENVIDAGHRFFVELFEGDTLGGGKAVPGVAASSNTAWPNGKITLNVQGKLAAERFYHAVLRTNTKGTRYTAAVSFFYNPQG